MSFNFGTNSFPELTLSFSHGGGDNQANNIYCEKRTINATTDDDLDLAGSLTNGVGETITFAAIKMIAIAIDSPDGSKIVRIGPQNVSNAFQGPWGGTGASNYVTTTEFLLLTHPDSGWTVTAGTGDILRLHNPGGSAIDVHVLLIGD